MAQDERPGEAKRKVVVAKPGNLPVDELLFTRQGPPSPFGEDVEFPLPVDELPYRHPEALTPY